MEPDPSSTEPQFPRQDRGSLEGKSAVSLGWLTEHMSVRAEDRVIIDPAIWETLAQAIERQDILRADYRRFDGKSGPHEILTRMGKGE